MSRFSALAPKDKRDIWGRTEPRIPLEIMCAGVLALPRLSLDQTSHPTGDRYIRGWGLGFGVPALWFGTSKRPRRLGEKFKV
jgi:hypothetical protein